LPKANEKIDKRRSSFVPVKASCTVPFSLKGMFFKKAITIENLNWYKMELIN
jgi:hypothetical protein